MTMFAELYALATTATLMMVVSADEKSGRLTISVLPKPKKDVGEPALAKDLTLTATPEEFDAGFIAALRGYRMPQLEEDESIAIDLHTHGRSRAFWSPIDNGDDQGIKVAGVFAHLHLGKPSAAFRLAVNGFYQPLRHPWEQSEPTSGGLAAGPRRSILSWLGWERGRIWNM